MIELRWLVRPLFVMDGPLPDGITGDIPNVRVLQYRRTLSSKAWLGVQSDADYEVAKAAMEWRDVPTESQMTVSEPPRADNETQEAK